MEAVLTKNQQWFWEKEIPEGWRLGRWTKGKRSLFFHNVKLKTFVDDFSLRENVFQFIKNPPAKLQRILVEEGSLAYSDVTEESVQKYLIKSGRVSIDIAKKLFPKLTTWLLEFQPNETDFDEEHYIKKGSRWQREDGSYLPTCKHFFSVWDARIRYQESYNKPESELQESDVVFSDVIDYSWIAGLEVIGDTIENIIADRIYDWNLAIFTDIDNRFRRNHNISAKDNLTSAEIAQVTQEVEAAKNQIAPVIQALENPATRAQFLSLPKSEWILKYPIFLECGLSTLAQEDIRELLQNVEAIARDSISEAKLVGFRWNGLLRRYNPIYAPEKISASRLSVFLDLAESAVLGHISGHEAALRFSHNSFCSVKREHTRFLKQGTQFLPFYERRARDISDGKVSFSFAVRLVQDNAKHKRLFNHECVTETSFVYGNLRFMLDVESGYLTYLGPRTGKYLPEYLTSLAPAELVDNLPKGESLDYCLSAVRKYRRCLSYLSNVLHKAAPAAFWKHDQSVAKRKHLKHSETYLNQCQTAATQLLEEYYSTRSIVKPNKGD